MRYFATAIVDIATSASHRKTTIAWLNNTIAIIDRTCSYLPTATTKRSNSTVSIGYCARGNINVITL